MYFAGRPLIEYAERLLKFPDNIDFFFHAGETNWMGTTSDENLVKMQLICLVQCLIESSSRTIDRRRAAGNEAHRARLQHRQVSERLKDGEGEEDWN